MGLGGGRRRDASPRNAVGVLVLGQRGHSGGSPSDVRVLSRIGYMQEDMPAYGHAVTLKDMRHISSWANNMKGSPVWPIKSS